MTQNQKYKLFEYMVDGIVDWYNEIEDKVDITSKLNRLKLIKLHFFICAASTEGRQEGLLAYFDKFHAMPFGHVESDIYDKVKDSLIPTCKYRLGRNNITISSVDDTYYNEIVLYMSQIDEALNIIKAKNNLLVTYKSFDLVELSHAWTSWKIVFNKAKSNNVNSLPIPKQLIINENKFYHLKAMLNVYG